MTDGKVCSYGSQTLLRQESYGWDKVGNPTHGGAQVAMGNRLTQINGFTLEYDADGNVTRKYKRDSNGTLTLEDRYFWNSLNQLDSIRFVRAECNGYCSTAHRGYDGFGRKTRKYGGNNVAFVYIHDGDAVFLELDEAGNRRREFTYYPGVDRPHSLHNPDGKVYYYATDNPGNVVGMIDANNQPLDANRYTPWGVANAFPLISLNPLRFMAVHQDEGDLQLMRPRWYDPSIGRFLSEDPIGLAGGINPYTFVANAPMDNRDPSGLAHCGALQPVLDHEVGTNKVQGHGCGGFGAITLPGITTTASSPFSTPRSQGTSANFGNRGYTGSAFTTYRSPIYGGPVNYAPFSYSAPSDFGIRRAMAHMDALERRERNMCSAGSAVQFDQARQAGFEGGVGGAVSLGVAGAASAGPLGAVAGGATVDGYFVGFTTSVGFQAYRCR